MVIRLDPNSELARELKSAPDPSIVVESDGTLFRVTRLPDQQHDLPPGYDPEAVRAAIRAAAGTFTPEEAERLKEQIYEWRQAGTRPPDRP